MPINALFELVFFYSSRKAMKDGMNSLVYECSKDNFKNSELWPTVRARVFNYHKGHCLLTVSVLLSTAWILLSFAWRTVVTPPKTTHFLLCFIFLTNILFKQLCFKKRILDFNFYTHSSHCSIHSNCDAPVVIQIASLKPTSKQITENLVRYEFTKSLISQRLFLDIINYEISTCISKMQ